MRNLKILLPILTLCSFSLAEDLSQPSRIDTVFVVKESSLSTLSQEISGIKAKIDKSRRQGYGGAGGWTPVLMVADLKPVKELLSTDAKLLNKKFDLNRISAIPGSGGMGYGGIGHGVRIGGGGFGGSTSFTSKPWGEKNDSITKITVELGYGGFIVEKAFVNEKLNYIIGGLIGGGSYVVKKNDYKSNEPSAFKNDKFNSSDDPQAEAAFTALGLHAGITYSMLPWFHVGGDASIVSFIGTDGFDGVTDSFITGLGAIRIRLIWGNLG